MCVGCVPELVSRTSRMGIGAAVNFLEYGMVVLRWLADPRPRHHPVPPPHRHPCSILK